MIFRIFLYSLMTVFFPALPAIAADGPGFQTANQSPVVVLELFTSQSCSSCPPADRLLKKIAEDNPDVLALSFHVDYWDHLSWKDTYSSPLNTERQRVYSKNRGSNQVFTPQLIVNGEISLVGSDERGITKAIAAARQAKPDLRMSIEPKGGGLILKLISQTATPFQADLWEVRFNRYASTTVKAGENGGRVLDSINNVTSIKPLTTKDPSMIVLPPLQDDGVAVLAQEPHQGRILGATLYLRPQ